MTFLSSPIFISYIYRKIFKVLSNFNMIKMVNTEKIAKMDEEKRKEEMSKVFEKLFKDKEEKQIKTLKEMVTDMKKATDDEYLNLCLTNMGIAATLPEDQLKGFITVRMKANSELPDELKTRDMKMLNEAMAKAPEDVKAKLAPLMPK